MKNINTQKLLNNLYKNTDNINNTKNTDNTKKPIFIPIEQQTRRYTFPKGIIEIKNVISINISNNGTHRLNTKDGKKHIVPKGWLHIEFDAKNWTF